MQKTILMIVTVALVGCGGDPNKKANELFVEAVQLIASGDEQTGEEAIKDYEQGLAKIQTIIDDFSESDLAVKLISGETLFTGKSLKGVKERVMGIEPNARFRLGNSIHYWGKVHNNTSLTSRTLALLLAAWPASTSVPVPDISTPPSVTIRGALSCAAPRSPTVPKP